MERKNIIKLVITFGAILLIVVATFVYGSNQRKEQQKGQVTSTQTSQQAQNSNSTAGSGSLSPQGGGAAPSNQPKPAAPPAGRTPQTGPEGFYALAMGIITVLYFYNRKLTKKTTHK